MNYPKIDRPAQAGWYWFRAASPTSPWVMIEIFTKIDGSLWVQPPVPMHARPLSSVPLFGDWRGPIPEPTP